MADYFKRKLGAEVSPILPFEETGIEYVQDNWHPDLTDEQLNLIFNKGASLNIFLRPSKEIKSRGGDSTYIENYALPVIYREGDRYIATNSGLHVDKSSVMQHANGHRSFYSYSNCGAGFMNYLIEFGAEPKAHLRFMSKVRYEEMEWIIRDNFELLFDGVEFEGNKDILQAIRAGRDFRISLTLKDGRQYRLDTDLLFYFPEKNETYGYTKMTYIPTACGSPQELHDMSLNQLLGESGEFDPEMNLSGTANYMPLIFFFYGDGCYSNAFMEYRGEKEPIKNIKIFASKN